MLATLLVLVGFVSPCAPQEGELDWRGGEVELAGGVARADLPEGWTYLDGGDARFVVEDLWGNPPDPTVAGLICPPGMPEGEVTWAIIVSYSDDGHIDDGDAAEIDYDDLLESMQEDSRDSNEARRRAGYGTVELLGWAEAPHYDSAEKKIYWARNLRFEGESEDTLNYDVRILGRHGALVLSAVASASDLEAVAAGCKRILAVTEFVEGQRYGDFDSSIDSYAAYGIGGLVAGKVLAKVGLFKGLMLFLAKGWKLVAVAAVAVVAFVKRMFGGGRASAEAEA